MKKMTNFALTFLEKTIVYYGNRNIIHQHIDS